MRDPHQRRALARRWCFRVLAVPDTGDTAPVPDAWFTAADCTVRCGQSPSWMFKVDAVARHGCARFHGVALMKPLILGALCAIALAGCSDPEAERQKQAAAAAQEHARQELAAEAIGKQYDSAVAAAEWEK